jgi:GntR family transcriptional regulator
LGKEKHLIILDYKDSRPIYEQIVARFQDLILKGALEVDTQLPSVRNLAMELSINPNTIQRAYTELERQGFIYSIKGRGNFIAANEHLKKEKREEIFQSILKLVKEARGIGIKEDELIHKIAEGYKEDRVDD